MNNKINCFKVISFDLDNTLYDNIPVLARAENKMNEFLTQVFEEQSQNYVSTLFSLVKKKLMSQNISFYENMSFLRQTILEEVCYPLKNNEAIAQQAFDIFMKARSEVVIESELQKLLHDLSIHYSLVSTTNGNCDINRLSINPFFKKNYSTVMGYRAKPHAEMLNQIIQDFSIQPKELLHVGDSTRIDGGAASNANAKSFYFSPFVTGNSTQQVCKKLKDFLKK